MDSYKVELFIAKGDKLTEFDNCFKTGNERKLWIKRAEEKALSEYYRRKISLKE